MFKVWLDRLEEGKTGPVSEEKAKLVSEPAPERETETISEWRELEPSRTPLSTVWGAVFMFQVWLDKV